MGITNKALIKQIEKKFNVVLNFVYVDCYGLYCEIYKPNEKDYFLKYNVYDSANVGYLKTEMLREFLNNDLWVFLDTELKR